MARPVQAGCALRGRFDLVTICVHWLTVVLVLSLIATGLSFDVIGDGPFWPLVFTVHRSIGFSVWVLVCLRIAWRMTHARFPPFAIGMNIVHRWVVTLSEYALYALLLLQPVTGMIGTLLSGKPFGLFVWTVPALLPRMPDASVAARRSSGRRRLAHRSRRRACRRGADASLPRRRRHAEDHGALG